MKIHPAVLSAVLTLIVFVAGIITAASAVTALIVISYAVFLPAFAAGSLLTVIYATGEWKPIQIGKAKPVPNEEYIREMESELGMGDFGEADNNDVLPWLSNYPIPDGWRWEFEKQSVVVTSGKDGRQSTSNRLAVFLVTSAGEKWKLSGTTTNDYNGENNSMWVNPVPADTFEQRLEYTVAKTHRVVMDKHAGELAMDEIVNKSLVKKYGRKNQIEW